MANFRQGKSGFGNRSEGSRFSRNRSEGSRTERKFSERSDRSSGERRRPLELHDAVCANCSKQTKVPFRPSGNKPVYCRECFEKQGDSSPPPSEAGRDKPRIDSNEIDKIHLKLDKIISLLYRR